MKKNFYRYGFFVSLILIAVLVFAGFSSISVRASEIITIRIGLVGPLTGDFAAAGYQQLNGVTMAVDEINKMEEEAGGNIRIELFSEDDAGVVDQSVSASIRLFTQRNVHALLGALNSPATLAIVPVGARYGVPQYTVSVGTTITMQGSQYIYRVAPAAALQTSELARFAVEKLGHENIAIAYTQDEYGLTCAEGFQSALRSMDMEPVAMEPWTRGSRDFTGLITRISRTPATAIYLTGSPTDFAQIARQIDQAGLKLQILGDTGMADPSYVDLGGAATEGSVFVEPFSVHADIPLVQEFVNNYRERFNIEPHSWAAELYDSVYLIYAAVKDAGAVSREIINNYTRSLSVENPFRGVMGDIYFDETGEPYFQLYKTRITDGQKELLELPY